MNTWGEGFNRKWYMPSAEWFSSPFKKTKCSDVEEWKIQCACGFCCSSVAVIEYHKVKNRESITYFRLRWENSAIFIRGWTLELFRKKIKTLPGIWHLPGSWIHSCFNSPHRVTLCKHNIVTWTIHSTALYAVNHSRPISLLKKNFIPPHFFYFCLQVFVDADSSSFGHHSS